VHRSQWYAVYTQNRHEKKVAERLRAQGMESYVPLLEVPRRYEASGRNVIERIPVFPGYVFVHITLDQRVRVLATPSVLRLVEGTEGPLTVSEEQIDTVRISLASYRVAPHAYLSAGRAANIIRGPLSGRRGVLADGTDPRVVFNLDAIRLGIAVDVAAADIDVV
jgi:transcription antitermination factor NusG